MASYSKDDYFVGSDLSDLSDLEEYLDTIDRIEDAENNGDEDSICTCGQVGTMDMIFCENPSCSVRWFHYECVGLTKKTIPKGKWLCVECERRKTATEKQGRKSFPAKKDVVNKKKETSTDTTTSRPTGKKANKKKRKEKVLRPQSCFVKEMAVQKALVFTMTTLKAITEQPVFKLEFPNIKELQILVSLLLEKSDDARFKTFFENIIGKLWECLNAGRSKFLSVEADNAIWRSFHLLKTTTIDPWHQLLRELNFQFTPIPANILLQELLVDLMNCLICESNKVDNTIDDSTPSNLVLTKDEEEILRYVSGYIPHALLKRYKKLPKNPTAIAFSTELSMWREQDEVEATSFFAYTNSWIEKQNRGGLFRVNDKVFLLFREIEVEFQQHVSGKSLVNLRGVNINNLLMGKLNQNKKVDRCWCAVVNGRLHEKLSLELQQKVFMYWIKIRSKAFVKVYLDLQKKKNNTSVSQRGEKALRKTVSS